MSLFSDLGAMIGEVMEPIKEVKEDLTNAVQDTAATVRQVRDDVTESGQQLKDQATDIVDTTKNKLS